jgi:hypothetical protein
MWSRKDIKEERSMKKSVWSLVLISSLVLVCPVLAQPGPGGGMGMGGSGFRIYNPQTVTTLKGTVEKVEDVSMGHRGWTVREMFLKTANKSIMVFLGPSSYLDQQNLTVKTGDSVEVTGSQVTLENLPTIIAKDITVNGKTWKLRDDQGRPAWSRPGMGPGGGQGKGATGK